MRGMGCFYLCKFVSKHFFDVVHLEGGGKANDSSPALMEPLCTVNMPQFVNSKILNKLPHKLKVLSQA